LAKHKGMLRSKIMYYILNSSSPCGLRIVLSCPRSPQRMRVKQAGFSLIELLVVVAVILIVAAIAIPNLLRSRMAANEASAVASLRSINTSQVVYQNNFGPGYAPTLLALSDGGAPANCPPGTSAVATSSCLIDPVLASGTKTGYNFTYAPVMVGGYVSAYAVSTDPVSVTGGQRHFFTDQSLVIRANTLAVATVADPPI
jgi:type IV pilus assembly protein PilA